MSAGKWGSGMMSKLLAAGFLTAVSAPAMAADFSLYLSGVLASDAYYNNYASDPDTGDLIVVDSKPLAGFNYKATLDFVRVSVEGITRLRLNKITTNLPIQFDVNRPSQFASFDRVDIRTSNTINGPDTRQSSSIQFYLAGMDIVSNGDIETFKAQAFNSSLSKGSLFYFSSSLNSPGESTTSQGNFSIDRVSSSPFAVAVPEPASWALMIGGFGVVGGAMRRRSSRATTARVAYY